MLLIKRTQVLQFVTRLVLMVILFNLHPIISVSLQTKERKGKKKLTIPYNNILTDFIYASYINIPLPKPPNRFEIKKNNNTAKHLQINTNKTNYNSNSNNQKKLMQTMSECSGRACLPHLEQKDKHSCSFFRSNKVQKYLIQQNTICSKTQPTMLCRAHAGPARAARTEPVPIWPRALQWSRMG